MKEKRSLILKAYCKEHVKWLVAYAGMILAFYIVASLYSYTRVQINMFYAVVLTSFFGLLAAVIDYVRYEKRTFELMNAGEKRGERDSYLPSEGSYIEKLYQEIIQEEEQEQRDLITEYDEKAKDMADYYTMWAHQIKTPISALRLLMDQNEGGAVPKEASEELFKIEQYTEMALNYARLDSLSSDLLFQKQDICSIVKQAVKKYFILFIGSNLSFSLEEFQCKAITDEKWLSFVIEQILSNALKYTQKGGISIYGVDEKGNKTNGQCKSMIIEDTGIGIVENDLPRIFERGFTGYNGRMDKKSTGIGLYLCRQIMDKLSHTIRVESRKGMGTRVILDFESEM